MAVHHPTEYCVSCGEALEQEYNKSMIESGVIGDAYVGTKPHKCDEEKLQAVKEDFEKQVNLLVANEHFLSDEDLAKRLKRIGESSKAVFFALSYDNLNRVTDRRIRSHCERKGTSIDKYDGPLQNSITFQESMAKIKGSLTAAIEKTAAKEESDEEHRFNRA